PPEPAGSRTDKSRHQARLELLPANPGPEVSKSQRSPTSTAAPWLSVPSGTRPSIASEPREGKAHGTHTRVSLLSRGSRLSPPCSAFLRPRTTCIASLWRGCPTRGIRTACVEV